MSAANERLLVCKKTLKKVKPTGAWQTARATVNGSEETATLSTAQSSAVYFSVTIHNTGSGDLFFRIRLSNDGQNFIYPGQLLDQDGSHIRHTSVGFAVSAGQASTYAITPSLDQGIWSAFDQVEVQVQSSSQTECDITLVAK